MSAEFAVVESADWPRWIDIEYSRGPRTMTAYFKLFLIKTTLGVRRSEPLHPRRATTHETLYRTKTWCPSETLNANIRVPYKVRIDSGTDQKQFGFKQAKVDD